MPHDAANQHLHQLLHQFRTTMLNTRGEDNHLRSHPMAMVFPPHKDLLEGASHDDVVYLLACEDTSKVDDIRRDNHVNLAFQSSSTWVSLCGQADIVKDRALLEKLWDDSMFAWFPQGVDTPALVLLRVRLHQGEYWDQSSLTDKVKFYFESGLAYIHRRGSHASALGTHERVQLAPAAAAVSQ